MLDGNKNEDLEMLTNLYDQYGKRVLTPDYNVNYEILKNLDIKSLNRFCSTNQNARELCNNKQFWQEKFLKDDLPILFNINRINDVNVFVKIYILTKQAKTDVRRMLIIKNILEMNVILIKGSENVLYTIVGVESESKKRGFVEIYNDKTAIINNKKYKINERLLVHNLINIQYGILNNLDYSITDINNIPYLVNQDVIDRYVEEGGNAYYNNIDTLNIRNAMYNTIVFLVNTLTD